MAGNFPRDAKLAPPRARGAPGSLLLALAGFLLLLFQPAYAEELKGLVARVEDGDSIVLASGSRVRYLGIDCPELARDGQPDMPLAKEATGFNRSLVLGTRVILAFDIERRDPYNRLLAYVYLPDGTFVNGLLVKNGLAWVYTRRPNLKMRAALIALQREAIAKKRGVWSLPGSAPEPFYTTGKNSFIFHRPSCRSAAGAKGRIFKDRMDAFWEGYAPCRSCNP